MSPEERLALAKKFAPVLVLWPEIPASTDNAESKRAAHSRRQGKSATQKVSGAHIARDYHPRDVRHILMHARAYEPRPPLPFVGIGFAQAYRDMANLFFWPILVFSLLTLGLVALATGLEDEIRLTVQITALAVFAIIWLATFRTPILVPTNSWHLLNHIVIGAALGITWVAIVGINNIGLVPIVVTLPPLSSAASGLLLRVRRLALLPIYVTRFIARVSRQRNADSIKPDVWTSFTGGHRAHEYSAQSELFFVSPSSNAAIHRSDREKHWSAYGRIIAERDFPRTCYARVLDADPDGTTTIQYWLCFYYDDWANAHEGDWESVVIFIRNGEPVRAAASSHEAGELRDWKDVETRDGRPVVYVSAGSHALYLTAGAHETRRDVLGLSVSSRDATLVGQSELDFIDFTPVESEESEVVDDATVVLIPDPDRESGLWSHTDHEVECETPCLYDLAWLNYPGTWGGRAFLNGGASAPVGPAFAGLRWDDPRMWSEVVCRRYDPAD